MDVSFKVLQFRIQGLRLLNFSFVGLNRRLDISLARSSSKNASRNAMGKTYDLVLGRVPLMS